MKILVVVDSINIEDSSGSKANVALINNLVAAGFEVIVYHYTLNNIQLSGATCFAIPEIKVSPLYFLSRFQRIIQRNSTINLAPFFERLFGFSFTLPFLVGKIGKKMTHVACLLIGGMGLISVY